MNLLFFWGPFLFSFSFLFWRMAGAEDFLRYSGKGESLHGFTPPPERRSCRLRFPPRAVYCRPDRLRGDGLIRDIRPLVAPLQALPLFFTRSFRRLVAGTPIARIHHPQPLGLQPPRLGDVVFDVIDTWEDPKRWRYFLTGDPQGPLQIRFTESRGNIPWNLIQFGHQLIYRLGGFAS